MPWFIAHAEVHYVPGDIPGCSFLHQGVVGEEAALVGDEEEDDEMKFNYPVFQVSI